VRTWRYQVPGDAKCLFAVHRGPNSRPRGVGKGQKANLLQIEC
jgi:hypothetical protein